MKKGIIFTLDVTLAVIMALSIIIISLFYLSQSNVSFEKENLYKMTMDSLSILEKNNVLRAAASTNTTTALQNFLNMLPYNTCGKVEILDKNNERLLTAIKTGCTYSDDYLISRRVFIANNAIFIAKMEAWFK